MVKIVGTTSFVGHGRRTSILMTSPGRIVWLAVLAGFFVDNLIAYYHAGRDND